MRAVVPGTGSDEKSCVYAAYGSPALAVPSGPLPAPLSKSTRTCGSCWNAASARSYVGSSWTGSSGNVTTSVGGSPIACWNTTGAAAWTTAAF